MRRLFELINKNISLGFLTGKKRSVPTQEELPLITISREKGSGGRPIAYLVAKKLGRPWKVFHKEVIDELAKEVHLEKRLVKEIDENRIPLIEEVIGDFFGKKYLTLSTYYKHLVKILSTVGHRGFVIIVGRGANYLFPQALTIRTICEMEQRIKWLMEFEKIAKNQAINRIEESDRKRYEFERAVYDHDIRKAHHYDLVIRTGPRLGIEAAADLIVMMTKRRFRL
ncbi:cytidylate kinase-like family protein [Candidatus Roizmanbacteria bacterium]|nr:cytidylate kinase-like family protein [Candidatus Roizmanbacteria bacterium]